MSPKASATITVTATDAAGAYAMQTIIGTVSKTAPDTMLTAPSGVVASSLPNSQSISVTWDPTSIQNAELIQVALFNEGVTNLAPLI